MSQGARRVADWTVRILAGGVLAYVAWLIVWQEWLRPWFHATREEVLIAVATVAICVAVVAISGWAGLLRGN